MVLIRGQLDRDPAFGYVRGQVAPKGKLREEDTMESFMNETQVSEKIQVSLACLRRWRHVGEGPQYVTAWPLVRYRAEAITKWAKTVPTGANGQRGQPNVTLRRRLAPSTSDVRPS